MYLFTRRTRLGPAHQLDGMEWAIKVTEKVNQITSLNVGLWSPILSPGLGSLSWGCAVEHLSDLEESDSKLQADSMFLDAVQRGAEMTVGGVDDETAQFLHGGTDTSLNPSYVAVVRSQIANGAFARGVEVGIEIAQRATGLGNLPTSFLLSTTGTYAGCAWITAASTLRELEDGEQAVNMSPDFVSFLDKEAKDCFVEGITTQAIWRRIV